MWRKSRAALGAATTTGHADALYQQLWKEHPAFCQSYPIVLGEMVQGRYSQKAFKQYLKYLSTQTWAKDKDAWLRSQAHYSYILYKCLVPHYNIREAAKAEEFTYQHLKAEDTRWETNIEQIKQEMENESREKAEVKRKELRDYLERLRGDTPKDSEMVEID